MIDGKRTYPEEKGIADKRENGRNQEKEERGKMGGKG